MDLPELAKQAFSRVQRVEPDNVGKILGCILFREPDEEETMAQLAYGPDADVLAKIADAKATLAAIYHHQFGGRLQAAAARPVVPVLGALLGGGFHVRQSQYQYWAHAVEGGYALQNQMMNGLLDDDDDHYYAAAEDSGGRGLASSRRPNPNATGGRPCHYFFKGNCKNGQSCHYSHHSYDDELGLSSSNNGGHTPGAFQSLESEITELLHSRRGQPVSIASLPTLYGDKYGKGLQADGYLTESQRHGKAGYSLTKLLSRLNKIRVIERPHGQHSVVLAEDASRYTDYSRADRGSVLPPASSSSHQIYLTFPADSIFTEEDVANYFGQYGLVRDVRIPCQEWRMFGFVSFQSPETVDTVLMRRNPHFICGSRVLVKPYREKSKCIQRCSASYPRTTYVDKIKPMMHCYPTRFFDVQPAEFYPGDYDTSSRLMRKQLTEKRERLIELERKRLAGIRLEPLRSNQFAYFDCSIEDVHTLSTLPPDSKDTDPMAHPVLVSDPLNIVSTSQAPPHQQTGRSDNFDDQESNRVELLPESLFESAAPAGNSVSGII